MREMSKWNSLNDIDNGVIAVGVVIKSKMFTAGPAHFGKELSGNGRYFGTISFVEPANACTTIQNKLQVDGKFGVAVRGQCTFAQKVRNIQAAGARLAVIIDNVPDSTADNSALFAMSGDGKDDIEIPAIFLFSQEGQYLRDSVKEYPRIGITVGELKSMKREYSSLCEDENCGLYEIENVIEPKMNIPVLRDRASVDQLKKLLSQLVTQFELTFASEESAHQKPDCKEEIIDGDVHIIDDRFTNEPDRRSICKKTVTPNPIGPDVEGKLMQVESYKHAMKSFYKAEDNEHSKSPQDVQPSDEKKSVKLADESNNNNLKQEDSTHGEITSKETVKLPEKP